MTYLLLILWILYALTQGIRDAYYYHYRNTSVDQLAEDLHYLYMLERGIVLLLIFSASYPDDLLSSIIFIIGLALIFSFIHNGIYYQMRNRLDPAVYPWGWLSSSYTSEATLEFGLLARTIIFIVGIIAIIISYVLR